MNGNLARTTAQQILNRDRFTKIHYPFFSVYLLGYCVYYILES